jgi:hypothetical protein
MVGKRLHNTFKPVGFQTEFIIIDYRLYFFSHVLFLLANAHCITWIFIKLVKYLQNSELWGCYLSNSCCYFVVHEHWFLASLKSLVAEIPTEEFPFSSAFSTLLIVNILVITSITNNISLKFLDNTCGQINQKRYHHLASFS